MKVITFATLKGGVGKTMLCFNIAGMLSQMGHKVLIIDSDLQGNLTNNMGLDRTKHLLTLYEVYNFETWPPLPPIALTYVNPNPKIPNVDIITSSFFLHKAEMRLASIPGQELILRDYFFKHHAFFKKYDYVLIDTNPSMGFVNQNAFAVSDAILLISDISMNAIEGAQLFIALWDEARSKLNLPDTVRGVIINNCDQRNRLSVDFLEYINTDPEVEDIRALMMKTVIPRTVKVTEAELAALPISLYDGKSKAAVALYELIAELKRKKIL
ncbi:MAG: ParA family protein [Defluviitaleaceae bacterium]|nr:ParA family protein [Defluviitaleaceae bacterium]